MTYITIRILRPCAKNMYGDKKFESALVPREKNLYVAYM